MADAQNQNTVGVAARGTNNLNGGTAVDTAFFLTNVGNLTISQLKTRLTAINATSYSAERLRTLSFNDMVYAVRLADQPASI